MLQIFRRTELAKSFVKDMLNGLTSNLGSGLFLSGPRRTGKTTFLQNDLIPTLKNNDIYPVYIDLWGEHKDDPEKALLETLYRHAKDLEQLNSLKQKAKQIGIGSINIFGTVIDFSDKEKDTRLREIGIVKMLEKIHHDAQKPIALLIDEAQQALIDKAGENMLYSLKSARDQMVIDGKRMLYLVMTGSDRDKLMRLVNQSQSPFLGSQIITMPSLGDDFVDHYIASIKSSIGFVIDQPEIIKKAFALFGYKPEFFLKSVANVLSNMIAGHEASFEHELLQKATTYKQEFESSLMINYLGMKPLEQAIYWRLLSKKSEFRLYDSASLSFYSEALKTEVTQSMVQTAIESMRASDIVWKSLRGEYTLLEDEAYSWYAKRMINGKWPPQKSELKEQEKFNENDYIEIGNIEEGFADICHSIGISDDSMIVNAQALFVRFDSDKIVSSWLKMNDLSMKKVI